MGEAEVGRRRSLGLGGAVVLQMNGKEVGGSGSGAGRGAILQDELS
jgi:hypothetical protein